MTPFLLENLLAFVFIREHLSVGTNGNFGLLLKRFCCGLVTRWVLVKVAGSTPLSWNWANLRLLL